MCGGNNSPDHKGTFTTVLVRIMSKKRRKGREWKSKVRMLQSKRRQHSPFDRIVLGESSTQIFVVPRCHYLSEEEEKYKCGEHHEVIGLSKELFEFVPEPTGYDQLNKMHQELRAAIGLAESTIESLLACFHRIHSKKKELHVTSNPKPSNDSVDCLAYAMLNMTFNPTAAEGVWHPDEPVSPEQRKRDWDAAVERAARPPIPMPSEDDAFKVACYSILPVTSCSRIAQQLNYPTITKVPLNKRNDFLILLRTVKRLRK